MAGADQEIQLLLVAQLGLFLGAAYRLQLVLAFGDVGAAADHAEQVAAGIAVRRAPVVQHPPPAVDVHGDIAGERLASGDRLQKEALQRCGVGGRIPVDVQSAGAQHGLQIDFVHAQEGRIGIQQTATGIAHIESCGQAVDHRPHHPHLLILVRRGECISCGLRTFHQAVTAGEIDQLRQGVQVELLLQARAVGMHGLLAERQLLGDLVVGVAVGEKVQDAQLAVGQLGDTLGLARTQRRQVHAAEHLGGEVAAAAQDGGDRHAEFLEVVVLADEASGAGLQETPGDVFRVLRAEGQHGHVQAACMQAFDDIQAVQQRQVDIDDQQVGVQVDGHRQRVDAIHRLADHLIPLAFQQQAHGVPGNRMLVGDQNSAHGASRGFCVPLSNLEHFARRANFA
ncbi:hypothetical protein D9M71_308520 [compost metagenome]